MVTVMIFDTHQLEILRLDEVVAEHWTSHSLADHWSSDLEWSESITSIVVGDDPDIKA